MKYDEEKIIDLLLKKMDNFSKKVGEDIWKVVVTYNDKELSALEKIFKEVVIDELFDNENTKTIYIEDVLDRITDIYYDEYYDEIWDIRYETLIELAQKTLNEITKENNIEDIDIHTLDKGNFVEYLFEEYKDFQDLDFQLKETLKRIKNVNL